MVKPKKQDHSFRMLESFFVLMLMMNMTDLETWTEKAINSSAIVTDGH